MTIQRRAAATAWALIGLLLGHQLAYAATYRDPNVLLHVLRDTGHNWLALSPVIGGLAVAIIFMTSAQGAARQGSMRRRFVTLAALQLSAYIAIEVIERLAHGSTFGDLPSQLTAGSGTTLLAFGVIAQLGVAAIVALLSRVVERVIVRLLSSMSRRLVGAALVTLSQAEQVVVVSFIGSRIHGVRAPPRL